MERDLRADLEKWAKIRYTPDRLQFADSIIEHAIERALKAEKENCRLRNMNSTVAEENCKLKAHLAKMQGFVNAAKERLQKSNCDKCPGNEDMNYCLHPGLMFDRPCPSAGLKQALRIVAMMATSV